MKVQSPGAKVNTPVPFQPGVRLGPHEILLADDHIKAPLSWSFPFLQTSFDEVHGQCSPNLGWIAYASNETGRYEPDNAMMASSIQTSSVAGPLNAGAPWVATDASC